MSQEAPTQTETPSDEGAPEQTTPVEGQELDAGTPPATDDEGSPATPEPEETPEESAAASQSAREKLRAKYPNLSDEEFEEVVAEHYWSTTKEISSREKRIRELEMELAARDEAAAEQQQPEAEPEPVSNPQIERLDKRIKTLYDRGQGYAKEQQELLQDLPKIDREIAKAEARIEDAGEGEYADQSKVEKWERVKSQNELRREQLLRNIRDLHYKREQADFEMETLLSDKDFLTKVAEQQRDQQKHEQQSLQQFNDEFPRYVDGLITQAADSLGAPKDEKIRESLWRSVNRAATMDFWRMARQGLDQVDVPKLIQGHVKEYLEERDLVGRVKFKKDSEEKLRVASRSSKPPSPPAAKTKPPVPVHSLGNKELTPAMAAARKYLAGRGL